jgi:predicted dehydrogenase
MLRGAIIGVGNVAVHGHLPGWLARHDIAVVAGTDVRPTRRLELQAHMPQAHWYDSAEALLAGEALDFVDICTPPATHAGLIRSALRHGLHVLCEKPLVCRPEDLSALARLAAKADRVLYTVDNWRASMRRPRYQLT